MESKPAESTRKHVRVDFPARVEFAGETFVIREFTANLSEGGAFLMTDQQVEPGTRGKLTFRISRWDEPFTVEAEVVRFFPEPTAEGWPPGLGVRFVDLDDTDRRRLHRLVEGVADGSVIQAIRRSMKESGRTLEQELRKRPTDQKMILALNAQAEEFEALIRDGNPVVVERLTANPRLQIPHVRTLLRDNRMTARVMFAVKRERKWMADEEVRYLFCKHPNAPLQDVLALLPELTPAQLAQLLPNAALRRPIREKVKQLTRKSL